MGEIQAAASGDGAPVSLCDYLHAPSMSGTVDVRRAAAWLASSMLLCHSDNGEQWREGFASNARRSARRTRGAGVARDETLVDGQSLRVALFYAKTGAIVRDVARLDPSLLRGAVGVTALLRATRANLMDVVRELLIAGVDPDDSNAPTSYGGTSAHAAALKGHTMCLEVLAEYGADVNARLPHAGTPLHIAALHGHTECVSALIALGGDVNAACALGLTPLHVAVLAGYADCVALLMANAANSKLRDARGHEPICYAVEKEDIIIESTIVALQGHYTSSNTPVPQNRYPTCGHNMARIYEACSFWY